jgi:hypothetical protein
MPGSGLHYRTDTSWGALGSGSGRGGRDARGGGNAGSAELPPTALLRVEEDGRIELVGEDGSPLPARQARAFREQNADGIEDFRARAAERWNAGIDEILGVHLSTPHPGVELPFAPRTFEIPRPAPFVPETSGLVGRLWRARRERIERENEAGRRAWEAAVAAWEAEQRAFQVEEQRRRHDHQVGRYADEEAMERVLQDRLSHLDWPRETRVSYQFQDAGRSLCFDVDLPEVEDMPHEEATPAARGLRLRIRRKSETQVRREYKRHVHGILFRIVGEAFHALPSVDEVIASGYSQRPNPATGHLRDDYLISARIRRETWLELNFGSLEAVDVVVAFERFDLRRRMTKTGIFRPVEPHMEGADV